MRKEISCLCLVFLGFNSYAQVFDRVETAAHLSPLHSTTGVAVADFDLDNDLDIFVVAKNDFSPFVPTYQSRLFSNNNDGTFQDITETAGLKALYDFDVTDPGWAYGVKMGASWGDYDNDGYPDLFLTNYHRIKLFHNEGDGTLQEVTQEAGFPKQDSCYNTSALWWDFNKDGYLDVYVSRWGGCPNNRYYQNNGNGTFIEKTHELGIGSEEEETWMAMPIDANKDGLWDLYLANDFAANELFIQQANNTFINEAPTYHLDARGNDMGITLGDYNNDGAYDIFISNIGENRLFTLSNNLTYSNVAESKNVFDTYWAWGCQFADFDLDGDEDLFIANGYQNDQIYYSVLRDNILLDNQHIQGEAIFKDISKEAGVSEISNSMAINVFDYDVDGDLDLFVSNMNDFPFFYDNKTIDGNIATTGNWVGIRLDGTISNGDGLGSQISVWTNGQAQHRLYNGANMLSQSLSGVHFGLGTATSIDSLIIHWDLGTVDRFYDLPINQYIELKENQGYRILNLQNEKVYGCTDMDACNYSAEATVNDGSCTYLPSLPITGNTQSHYLQTDTYTYPEQAGSSYHWTVTNGAIVAGQGTPTLTVQWEMYEEGQIAIQEINDCKSQISSLEIALSLKKETAEHSVARFWNEALLFAIRNDYARPTVHARNLFHISVGMYDAWAVYDEAAHPYLLGKEVHGFKSEFAGFETATEKVAAQKETISYAAYRLLRHRFRNSPKYFKSKRLFDRLFEELGYDKTDTSQDYTNGDPAALGNYIAQTIINYGLQDGAAEGQEYANQYYQTTNPPLVTDKPSNPQLQDPNRWQPLTLETFIDQAGNLIDGSTPDFLSPEWGNVFPFSLSPTTKQTYDRAGHTYTLYHDPSSPPLLDTLSATEQSDQYKWGFSMVSIWGAHLSPNDGVLWDISPASIGNIASSDFPRHFSDYPSFYKRIAGGDIGKGRTLNHITNQAYSPQLIPRGDYTRVLAEFWADGPDSETPPGHWFVLLNTINDHPLLEKKLKGRGERLSNLEWDVKSYFILGGTMHDAAISAWSIKGWYDYIRPISAIRYLASRGQSSDPSLPNYNIAGIPLEKDFIALVTATDELAGANGEHVGKIKLYSWRGSTDIINPDTDEAGVGWILAENWMPYQRPSFVTPPFAGYVSGHSTYSRAAAEVLTLLTGDEYFPGGIGEFMAPQNEFLVFEEGPSQDVVLQWATYRDASDQCSLSRIWGGIHPPADDLPGRLIGERIGQHAFEFALPYFQSERTTAVMSEELGEVMVYPNPITNSQSIVVRNTTADLVFGLMDLQGRSFPLVTSSFDGKESVTTLSFGELASGVYVLRVGGVVFKLIVV